MKLSKQLMTALAALVTLLVTSAAYAQTASPEALKVENGRWYAIAAAIGLGIAAMSFFTGNPNAKQHIVYAIAGCIFGFGAQAIVDFIAQTVR